ncbi:AraC family transcriptional regulator [Flavisphingomonas formosensis]|uniref:AraC family transcriptional regulator n=1 Tax=Flavisphingomonas formosensis TaxID=861534 RepID=UPI0012FCAC92|nr:helix-turn-helix transcriptional regulator [Sphingomonas formosensis]
MKRSLDLPLTIRPVVGMEDCYPAGYVDLFHSHDRSQLCLALTGVMSVTTDLSTYVLPANRAIWLPAGTRHQVACRGEVKLHILYLEPDLPGQPADARVFDVSMLLRALIQEVLTFDHAYDERGREGRIVALMLEEIARMPSIPLAAPTPKDKRLRRVCDLIISDPGNQADLDALARLAGMGRRTFTRAFRNETGMAFAVWRQQIRLMAALSMLGDGKSITSIAYDVGYESPSSFTAMFNRVLGVPPSHYARSRVT